MQKPHNAMHRNQAREITVRERPILGADSSATGRADTEVEEAGLSRGQTSARVGATRMNELITRVGEAYEREKKAGRRR